MLLPFLHPGITEAGCDEAGRGCLAGPVACGSVILPPDFTNEILNDSKQLSEKKRDSLRIIIEKEAIAWKVVMIEPEEIDRINILNASLLGMWRAANALSPKPDHLLIDGNRRLKDSDIPQTTVVKGDATYMSIAAASILAKTHRDEYMREIAKKYPGYGWERNMGYPTKEHKEAILRLGLAPWHRKSFGPCSQPSLFDL